jgi:hypothetical protein
MYKLQEINGKLFCKNSHEYTEENTIWVTNKLGIQFRQCRVCKNAAKKRYYERRVGHETNGNPQKEKTHCDNGHEFTEENTAYTKAGYRHCRQCSRDSANRVRIEDPEGTKLRKKEWQSQSRYGLSVEERVAMLAAQGGKCAVCGRSDCEWGKVGFNVNGWSTDHNHTTNQVRSILCQPCNILVGQIETNKDKVLKILDYLERFKCGSEPVLGVEESYVSVN